MIVNSNYLVLLMIVFTYTDQIIHVYLVFHWTSKEFSYQFKVRELSVGIVLRGQLITDYRLCNEKQFKFRDDSAHGENSLTVELKKIILKS
jgi:hypothetical protein